MKKLILMFSAVMCFFTQSQAVTKTWVGTSGGTWSTSANWSPVNAPGSLDDVIINTTTTISIDVAPTINSLSIQGTNTVVDLTSATTRKFWINNGSTAIALSIAAGCTLNYGVHGSSTTNVLELNGNAEISGTLKFTGSTATITPGMNISSSLQKVTVKNGGKLIVGVNSRNLTTSAFRPNAYVFESNAEYKIERNGASILEGVYDPNSTVNITGVTTSASFTYGGTPNVEIGNLTWNCSGQTAAANLTTPTTYNIKGKVKILNTGATPQELRFCSGSAGNLTIKDSLIVGANTIFSLTGGAGIGTVKLEKHLINNGTITEGGTQA